MALLIEVNELITKLEDNNTKIFRCGWICGPEGWMINLNKFGTMADTRNKFKEFLGSMCINLWALSMLLVEQFFATHPNIDPQVLSAVRERIIATAQNAAPLFPEIHFRLDFYRPMLIGSGVFDDESMLGLERAIQAAGATLTASALQQLGGQGSSGPRSTGSAASDRSHSSRGPRPAAAMPSPARGGFGAAAPAAAAAPYYPPPAPAPVVPAAAPAADAMAALEARMMENMTKMFERMMERKQQ